MSTTAPPGVSFERHLTGLLEAADRLARAVSTSWLGADVPTCPEWTVIDLLAHTGMVHRWALAAIRGDRETMGDAELIEEEGRTTPDPARWLRAGAEQVAQALDEATDDLEAMVFLKEAPPPKLFWARRQCHETTIHALDAVAARDGRRLTAADAWFDAELAADGVDELLVGFWQRGRSGPRAEHPYRAVVRATDLDAGWLLEVGPDRTVTTRCGAGPDVEADATLSGPAVDLYLALWNRGGSVDDPAGLLDRWHEQSPITWS